MAGVKGRSGGPRRGAGRKPKPKAPLVALPGDDTLELLHDIAFGRVPATTIQVRAAIAAVQYTHTKVRDGGKKEARQGAAEAAGEGKFAPKAQPLKLVKSS